ncbi:unnamed protein product [Hymenolepis diminuta]|uniref:Ovule protein n=1 Tax=Hymenolepis diminuta TaxID=6216 RepID=A0A0R3SK90_HYMDI|nr:unnamed protein product [Hymenolepis diminuta]
MMINWGIKWGDRKRAFHQSGSRIPSPSPQSPNPPTHQPHTHTHTQPPTPLSNSSAATTTMGVTSLLPRTSNLPSEVYARDLGWIVHIPRTLFISLRHSHCQARGVLNFISQLKFT